MEERTRALRALLGTIVDSRPVARREHAACVRVGNRVVRVSDLVQTTVDGIIRFFVESQHCCSVGGVMQRWDIHDDFVANVICDAFPQDDPSARAILAAFGQRIPRSAAARQAAAAETFTSAVHEAFRQRCIGALLDTERR